MGKVRKSKSYRQHQPAVPVVKKPKEEVVVEEVEDELHGTDSSLSRGQRKRQKRRDAFNKKMGMVQRTILQKENERNKKVDDDGIFGNFEDLQNTLFNDTITNEIKKKTKKLNGKQKKRLAMHELGHLKAVHTHPSFQANPFEAIQMHLQNTVVAAHEAKVNSTKSKK